MIILPKEKPAVQDLNSYYLKIEKLLEHCQGQVGTGGVLFKSPTAEAVIFFDETNLINAYYKDKKQEIKGIPAHQKIMEASGLDNFNVTVYYILPERVYFWAHLSNAELLYHDLSSEFTDLEGLIKKMENEHLTGFIDVTLNQGQGGGLLFVYNGKIIGGSSAKGDGGIDRSAAYRDSLIERSRKFGGMFHVSKIDLSKLGSSLKGVGKAAMQPAITQAPAPQAGPHAKRPLQRLNAKDALIIIQNLLTVMEGAVKANKRIKTDFDTLLSKQFVEKVNRYDFLDPFAAEFRYSGGKVTFVGKAGPGELVTAIVHCLTDMAAGLGMTDIFRKHLAAWKKQYADLLIDINMDS